METTEKETKNQQPAPQQPQPEQPAPQQPAPAAPPEGNGKKKNGFTKYIMPVVFVIIIIGGGIYGFRMFEYSRIHEDTDDAQVEGNIDPVLPRVPGYVIQLRVDDNTQVRKGDTLLVLDDRDLKIKVDQARVAVDNAVANLDVAKANTREAAANLQTDSANVESAKVQIWKTTQDYTRYNNLLQQKSGTQQQYDNAKAGKESAETALKVAQKQMQAAAVQYKASSEQEGVAQTTIDQRKADLDYAQLQLSYATITSPADGKVTRKNVQLGQYLQAGQQVMAIVADTDVWVVSNYKETQMAKMHVGESVDITVDAYGSKIFKGHIQSISAGTGAKFALLPPDNASGNFVKVVQRIPVKIVLDHGNDPNQPLRVGMSVKTSVLTN